MCACHSDHALCPPLGPTPTLSGTHDITIAALPQTRKPETDGPCPGHPVHLGSPQPQVSAHHPAWDDITTKLCLPGQSCLCTLRISVEVVREPPNRKWILMERHTPVLPYYVPSTHTTQGGEDGRGRGPGWRDQKRGDGDLWTYCVWPWSLLGGPQWI